MRGLTLHPTGVDLRPNAARVLIRPFIPGDAARIVHILGRALALTDAEVEEELARLANEFASRHLNLHKFWRRHFECVQHHLPGGHPLAEARRLYIGALFSGEYALEAAALFNPSIVAHPDQSGVAAGALRFIMSLRATGEGHISSIEFRTGTVGEDGGVVLEEPSRFVSAPTLNPNPTYFKKDFLPKLAEMGFKNDWSARVMEGLQETFTLSDLEDQISRAPRGQGKRPKGIQRTAECVRWLAQSNYEVHFDASVAVSERTIFPVSSNESNGMEDARFVRFTEDDARVIYYATYTAYNGRAILPQLLETDDFLSFRVCTLNGHAVQNKGMALFPRRIGGRLAMISRQDDENLYLMFSDNPHFWSDPQILRRPVRPWETVKIGNCGSPIETAAGWLVLTHGVGPMRKYCIGALLLDLDDPFQVLGELKQPLLEAVGSQREGYVPNVVYTCGALLHAGRLILPYGVSDKATTIVTIDLQALLGAMDSV